MRSIQFEISVVACSKTIQLYGTTLLENGVNAIIT